MRKPTRRKKSAFWGGARLQILIGSVILLFIAGAIYHYRDGLAYYLGFKSHKIHKQKTPEEKRISDVRNYQLMTKYEEKVIGFDVSQYQGQIDWSKVQYVENTFLLQFVFIRATAGKDAKDTCFKDNWAAARKKGILRGAYHYYRPNENSIEQAENFIRTVKLQTGDLPPVLDIEKLPEHQSVDSLKKGLRRWLDKVDKHYKVRPIIYTGEKYYDAFLKEEFKDYTFWIANYNFFVEDIKDDWLFWQFTESASVEGILGNVDVNIYNGTPKQLHYLTIN
ncbi:glycoside hydrolase family 25 protein [Flavobacterium caeni]|uniref:Lysozyme n=1 Tax=Flavobacterium caeni TaxID=490189 RepID=A0A1G5FM84_9FLAO|nr:glycoside hydrolase family 25 protein [Flavobacterium caeni]SCY40369.1 lysozyme [Flavobacterium caeni]